MASRTSTRVLERGGDGTLVTLSVIPGGLRVITESVPGARSASVGVWVGVGSVDETPRLAGASHFLEHLLFKGTRTRTGHQIAVAIDEVGGEINAFTAHEYTCYYAHVLASAAELAVETICDVVLDAKVAAADVEVERTVILEEIAMRDDDPEDTLGDAFAAAVFAGHRVAEPVIGTVPTISAMTRAQIAGYYRRRYCPEQMVVAVAGGVDHRDVVAWTRRAFAGRLDPQCPPPVVRSGHRRPTERGGLLVVDRDTEQAHLCLGVPALHRSHPDRAVLAVLSAALGGGMSSRLFRSIREEHGLAYSVYAATSGYADVGSFSVYAGCQPENLGTVAHLIGRELASVAEQGLSQEELARAKGQLTGGYLLGLEDTESRMSRIGKNLLVRGRHIAVDTDLHDIAKVTGAQVSRLAAGLLTGPLTAAVVGPYARSDELPTQLSALTTHSVSWSPGGRRAERQRRHVG